MPVPGQPNPLDLHKARKYTRRKLVRWFEQWVDVKNCPVYAHFFRRTSFACASLTDLDLAAAGKTASTAAGSEATAARAALPGPTSLLSEFKPETYRPAGLTFVICNLGVPFADLRTASVGFAPVLDAFNHQIFRNCEYLFQ